MTWILMGATFAMLTVLGVSCRRARLDLEEQLCECLQPPGATAVGFGTAVETEPAAVETQAAPPAFTPIDGGGRAGSAAPHRPERHLRVVGAR
jgi:hypothetical protein